MSNKVNKIHRKAIKIFKLFQIALGDSKGQICHPCQHYQFFSIFSMSVAKNLSLLFSKELRG